MKRYTVVLVPSAEDELMEIWLAASDRQSVTTAADEIEKTLGTEPNRRGMDVSEGLRSLSRYPIKVLYSVSEDDRTVEILCVRVL